MIFGRKKKTECVTCGLKTKELDDRSNCTKCSNDFKPCFMCGKSFAAPDMFCGACKGCWAEL